MKKTFNFGIIDFYNLGSKVNLVTIDVAYKPIHGNIKEFSAYCNIWDANKQNTILTKQGLDKIAKYIKDEAFDKVYRLWKLYHLNNHRSECEHQIELGWLEKANKKIKFYNWNLNKESRKEQKNIKNRAMTALKKCEGFHPTEHESFMINLSHSLKTNAELPKYLRNYYEPKKPLYVGDDEFIEEKVLGWISKDEHPDGLLGKPCPVCGHKFGQGWCYMPIPKEDEEIIIELLS